MYFAFVVKYLLPDGNRGCFAHMVKMDTKAEAEKRVRTKFEQEGWDGGRGGPKGTIEEIVRVGEHDDSKEGRKTHLDLYEKACDRCAQFEKETLPVESKQVETNSG